jgi:hypothetical protein
MLPAEIEKRFKGRLMSHIKRAFLAALAGTALVGTPLAEPLAKPTIWPTPPVIFDPPISFDSTLARIGENHAGQCLKNLDLASCAKPETVVLRQAEALVCRRSPRNGVSNRNFEVRRVLPNDQSPKTWGANELAISYQSQGGPRVIVSDRGNHLAVDLQSGKTIYYIFSPDVPLDMISAAPQLSPGAFARLRTFVQRNMLQSQCPAAK